MLNDLIYMTLWDFMTVYVAVLCVFSLGVVAGMTKRKNKYLTLDELADLFQRSIFVDAKKEDIETPSIKVETPAPIIDVKLGGVKRPSAQQLYDKEHPDEKGEMDAMREAMQRVIEKEKIV